MAKIHGLIAYWEFKGAATLIIELSIWKWKLNDETLVIRMMDL